MNINPYEKLCWSTCSSCYRCADKGRYAQCATCSGRFDSELRRYPDPDDVCDCKNGILRWVTKNGRRIVAKYPGNPFKGSFRSDEVTADERDWESFKADARERLDNPNWDPIQFTDGSSTEAWFNKHLGGS